ncbi:uncharacterized protein LOC144770585 isoform X3 [Lissotriton helveticus]
MIFNWHVLRVKDIRVFSDPIFSTNGTRLMRDVLYDEVEVGGSRELSRQRPGSRKTVYVRFRNREPKIHLGSKNPSSKQIHI